MSEAVKERQEERDETRGEKARPPAEAPVQTGFYPSPFEEMERLMETFFGRSPLWGRLGPLFEGAQTPKVDLIDRDHELVLRAELPGVNKDDLEVTLSEDSVTIRAQTRQESQEEKDHFLRREIRYGQFVRTIPLPAPVDVEAARSRFENGILELTMPKVARAKRRVIPVE